MRWSRFMSFVEVASMMRTALAGWLGTALVLFQTSVAPASTPGRQGSDVSLTDRGPVGIEVPDQPRNERDVDRLGWLAPDFAKIGMGGFVGLVTVGGGYALFDDVLEAGLLYGYTPAFHAGTDVHSLHFSVTLRPFDLRWQRFRCVPLYFGPGLLYTFGDNYFVFVPKRYPVDNYYAPTALHWTAEIGLELDYLPNRDDFFERHGLYFELRTLDTFLYGYAENRATLHPLDAVASGFGYRAAF
jgi:hypothetical protein